MGRRSIQHSKEMQHMGIQQHNYKLRCMVKRMQEVRHMDMLGLKCRRPLER